MAQFKIYRSNDAGAITDGLTLNGTVGSLITVLTGCLVNGYSDLSKPAAGWTKPFTGSNKAVFRPGSGTQLYFRVDDSSGATFALIRGYEIMTDVDTGTGVFPTPAQGTNLGCAKSATANATARDWILVADSRTMYFFALTNDTASTYEAIAFGDFYSFKSDDAYNCLIIGRTEGTFTTLNASSFAFIVNSTTSACTGHFMARGHTQLGGSVNFGKHTDYVKSAGNNGFTGTVPFTNPVDGGIYVAPLWIHDSETLPLYGLRGRMRGLWCPPHPVGSFADGDTFSGGAGGELAGKSFLCIYIVRFGSGGQNGTVVIETSNTLETN